MTKPALLKSLLIITVPALISTTTAAKSQQKKPPKPPVRIKGYDYHYIAKARIHMNVCRAKSCIPGTKVSYIIYRPSKPPKFADYDKQRNAVNAALQKRAKPGSKLKFSKTRQSKSGAFTVFTNERQQSMRDGRTHFVKSTTIFGRKATISLISSAPSQKISDKNRTRFMLPLLLWAK